MEPLTTSEATDAFFEKFHIEKQAIEQLLDQSSVLPKNQLESHFSLILQRINDLEKSTTDAGNFLPSYNERQFTLHIKDLGVALEKKKAMLLPKPKFSFKARKAKDTTQKSKTVQAQTQPTGTLTAQSRDHANEQWKIPTPIVETTVADNLTGSHRQVVLDDVSKKTLTLATTQPNDMGVNVLLSNLVDCIVDLRDQSPVSSLHIKNLTRCIIVSDAIQGPVLIYGLKHSILAVQCHQLRVHDAMLVDMLLHVSSHPIMEDSSSIRVGPYHRPEPQPNNCYDRVEDFNWLKKQASPNWSLLSPDKSSDLNASIQNTPKDDLWNVVTIPL